MKEFIEIPFGAKDSELVGWEYTIPEGMEATIVDNKIVVKKKENEDDKVRKELYDFCMKCGHGDILVNQQADFLRWATWLEKQGEQEPADKVEPKFCEGEWVVNKFGDSWHIDSFDKKNYQVSDVKGNYNYFPIAKQDEMHLWTIQDAKDGDVLSNGKMIVIFKHFEDPSYRQHIVAYVGLDTNGDIQITDNTWNLGIDKAKPATKEQRDLLFQKMHEAGYEWDADKKELTKIEQTSAWSEEDENRFRNLIYLVEHNEKSKGTKQGFIEFINRLKSLKEKYTWKPSDEQIEVLVWCKPLFADPKSKGILESLINDLKKLREE